jgi:hypothetical protein
MKIWKLDLTTLKLIQVAKFDLYEGCLTFKAENYLEADKFVSAFLKGEMKHIKEVPPEIDKIIEEIIYN